MKPWQEEAFRKLDAAVEKLKKDIAESDSDWEKVGGEISLEVSKYSYHPDCVYQHMTISTRLHQYV